MSVAKRTRIRKSSFPYTVQISSNLDGCSALSPMETTFVQVESHGAVTLFRFTSGEYVQRFDLSAAEFEALVASNRLRRSRCLRSQEERDAYLLGEYPY